MKLHRVSIHVGFLLVFVAACLTIAPRRSVALEVRVRAHTSLSLDLQADTEFLRITGTLRNDHMEPVVFQEVLLQGPGGLSEWAETDDLGRFGLRVSVEALLSEGASDTSLSFAASYSGDSRFGPTRVERTIDIRKENIALSIASIPARPNLGDEGVECLVEVSSGGQPVPEHGVKVLLPDGVVVDVTTDSAGEARVLVQTPDVPGRYPIAAHSGSTSVYNEASAEAVIAWVGASEISLAAAWGAEEALKVTGTLLIGGLPAGHRTLTLQIDDHELGLVVSDLGGRFEAVFLREELERLVGDVTSFGISAHFRPVTSWYEPTDSAVVLMRWPVPPSVPISLYLVPLALLFFFATGVRFRRFLREREPTKPPAVKDKTGRVVVEFSQDGVRAGAGSMRLHLGGVLWDPHTEKAVPGGTVRLLTDQGEEVVEGRADGSGRFSLEGRKGRFSLLAMAPGYLPQVAAVTLPHDGRLDAVRVHLRAIRVETLGLYESFLTPFWPEGSPWGHLTPREAQRALLRRVRRDQLLLREMTALVESTYFGPGDPSGEEIERVRALAASLQASMERRPL